MWVRRVLQLRPLCGRYQGTSYPLAGQWKFTVKELATALRACWAWLWLLHVLLQDGVVPIQSGAQQGSVRVRPQLPRFQTPPRPVQLPGQSVWGLVERYFHHLLRRRLQTPPTLPNEPRLERATLPSIRVQDPVLWGGPQVLQGSWVSLLSLLEGSAWYTCHPLARCRSLLQCAESQQLVSLFSKRTKQI